MIAYFSDVNCAEMMQVYLSIVVSSKKILGEYTDYHQKTVEI